MIAGGERIALPSQPVGHGKGGKHLELVAGIQRPLVEPDCVRVLVLDRLPRSRRQPQNECREIVVRERVEPIECGNARAELEAAASGLEGSALRLEMIDVGLVELDSKTQPVLPLSPAQVGIADILVIPEQKRITGVGIPHVGVAGNLERRYAALERVWTV